MRPLMPLVDVVIANEEDLQSVLGIAVPHTRTCRPARSTSRATATAAERVAREFGVRQVAVTLRESLSASDNAWSAVLFDAGQRRSFLQSQRYIVRLVDRIGGGDSFAAGLIYGLVSGRDREARAAVRRGGQRVEADDSGDFNHVSVAEVERLVAGDASGRVQR